MAHDPTEVSAKRLAVRRLRAIGVVTVLAAGVVVGAIAIGTREKNHDAAGRLKASPVLRGHTGGAHSLAFSPDGNTLAAAAVVGKIRLWDTSNWRLVGELPGHTPLLDAAFSPDGGMLVTTGEDGSVKLWDVRRRS